MRVGYRLIGARLSHNKVSLIVMQFNIITMSLMHCWTRGCPNGYPSPFRSSTAVWGNGLIWKRREYPFFVRFCEFVFGEFCSQVHLWCPINEPGLFVLCGYILGTFPPWRIYALSAAGDVFKNLLKAHIAVYKALKMLPHGSEAFIGFIRSAQKTPCF